MSSNIMSELRVEDIGSGDTNHSISNKNDVFTSQDEDTETEGTQTNSDKVEGEDENDESMEWQDILGSGGIMKRILRKGNGDESSKPLKGDDVEINIRGWLEDGTEIDCERNVKITVGESDVVTGIDLCLSLMEEGETSEYKLTDRFGYGTCGRSHDVPANAHLNYEVEVLKCLGPANLSKMSVDEKMILGDKKRSRGNDMYSRAEFTDAINLYTRAITILDDHHNTSGEPTSKLQEMFDLKLKCYNNLSAAQLKIEAFDAALKSCDHVLRAQPKNVKALFRKGKVLGLQGQTEQAIKILRHALQQEPDGKVIHQELSRLLAKQKKDNDKEKEMYRRMFGIEKEEKAKSTSPPIHSQKYALFGVIGAAITAIAGIAWYKLNKP